MVLDGRRCRRSGPKHIKGLEDTPTGINNNDNDKLRSRENIRESPDDMASRPKPSSHT